MKLLQYSIKALIASLIIATTPSAYAEDWENFDQVKVKILQGLTSQKNEQYTTNLGIHFMLEPGWKMYWKHPGEVGRPTTIEVSSQSGITKQIYWPLPKVHDYYGYEIYGYDDEVIIPIEITGSEPDDMIVNLHVEYGVCKDVCVPMEYEKSIQIDSDLEELTALYNESAIEAYKAQAPKKLNGLTISSVEREHDNKLTVSITVDKPSEVLLNIYNQDGLDVIQSPTNKEITVQILNKNLGLDDSIVVYNELESVEIPLKE